MSKYEALYILDTELDEESRNAVIEKLKGVVESSGEIESIEEWGTRKLAYLINKKSEGYYVKMNFSASPDVPKELARIFRITESVLRYLIIKEDE
ncbi:MAG: SSU ribosomal protein S6p [Firmicutes bacterium]|nr:SSU ribosomal protein S6p [Bacillota bacterium]MDI6705002.1 30S ribosomal protein S6 [Bacillota bacterium]